MQGSEYRADIVPPQRVALSGVDDAEFTPAWIDAHQSQFSGLAYALYAFDYDDAGTCAELTLDWAVAPALQRCWLGLPDYEYDRWYWQELPEDPLLIPDIFLYAGTSPEMTNFIPLVVVVTGTQPPVLDWLSLVEYHPASLSLLNEPAEGTGEATDPFLADASLTLFFSVFDAEGFHDVSCDARTVFSVEPGAAGEFQPLVTSVAFHTSAGYTGDYLISARFNGHPTEPVSLYITAVDNGPTPNELPVAVLSADPTSGRPPLSVDFDARGSYDPDGLVKIYRWDFDGDGTFDDTSNSRTISHEYSSEGLFVAKLQVEDADGALDEATVRISVTSNPAQWRLSIVQQAIPDGPSLVGEYCSIAEVDGRPAIAYADVIELEQASRLVYARALDALGAAWGDPVELRNIDSIAGKTGLYPVLRTIAGQPALAFSEQVGGYLPYYLRATDAQGANWPASPALIDATAGISSPGHVQLADVAGLPGVAYYEGQLGELVWLKGTDANGSAFGGRTVLDTKQGHAELGNVGEFCSMVLIDGNPAVSYLARYIDADTGNQVRYIRALDAAGTSWAAPVSLAQAPSIGHGTALLELADGTPGVLFQNYSATQLLYTYVHGLDAAGTSWSPDVDVVAVPDGFHWLQSPAAVVWEGKPLFGCIHDADFMDPDCSINCVSAIQPDGSEWAGPQRVADCGDSYSLSLAVVDGLPVMCYYNSVQQALYFGIYY